MLLLLIVLTLNLSACGIGQGVATPTPVQSGISKVSQKLAGLQDWQHHWLEGIPCRPPCWEGITPGQTSFNDAVELLKKNPATTMVQISEGSDKKPFASWNWLNNLSSANIQLNTNNGVIEARAGKSGTITKISSRLPASFKLGEIIRVYGEPSHVWATWEGNPHAGINDIPAVYFYVHLVYLPQGFKVYFWDNYKPVLSETSLFEEPVFFMPEIEGLTEAYSKQWVKFLVPWGGFQTFNFYCRNFIKFDPRLDVEKCSSSLIDK